MRSSGILMPIFSLPSPYGIGTLGAEGYRFVDFLKKAKQSYWQILPLGPTSYGDSPYQSFSSFAGNHYFIDIDLLINEGLLTKSEAEGSDFGNNNFKIDYEKLYFGRLPLLKKAFDRFKPNSEYKEFCRVNAEWLDDYANFMALKAENVGKAWNEWIAKKLPTATRCFFINFCNSSFFRNGKISRAMQMKTALKLLVIYPFMLLWTAWMSGLTRSNF